MQSGVKEQTTWPSIPKSCLAPIAQLDADKVRQQIDAVICKVLRSPDLGAIRALLAREPGLTAQDIAPGTAADDNDDDDDDAVDAEVN